MTAVARPAAAAVRAPATIDVPEMVVWALGLLMAIDYLGLASEFGILKVTRIGTLLAYGLLAVVVAKGGLVPAASTRQGKLLLGLMGMAAASIMYGLVQSYAPVALRSHVDYFVLFVVSASVVDRRSRVTKLAVVATAIILVLVARNVEPLTSSMRVAAFKAGVFMGDGNDFAWGLIALMPLPFYLMAGRHALLLRLVGFAGAAAVMFGVVGTQSRGATLGIVAAGLYYFVVLSKRRLVTLVVIAVLAGGALALSPESYLGRVTETDVANDSSAQGRLRAWRSAVRMALDYPLGVGAGSFNSAYGRFYIEAPDGVYASARWISAHSIYFKVLGEFGFVGLALLIGLLTANVRDNRRSQRAARDHPDHVMIEDRWPALLNLGMTGYAVAGAFLGGLTYPHLYLLSGLIVACRRMTVDRLGDTPGEPVDATAAAAPQLSIHPMLRPRPQPTPALPGPAAGRLIGPSPSRVARTSVSHGSRRTGPPPHPSRAAES
jgi:probable O-glycosylation ligase (exosortase A-associated)